jgi:hypothetical protein
MKTKTEPMKLPSSLNELEARIEEIVLTKLPQLPDNVKEAIVKYGPYISLVLLIMGLPVIFAAIGLGALLAPLAFLGGVGAGVGFSIASLIALVTTVMSVIALPGLFKRKMSAWRMMFWVSLVNAIGSILSFNIGSLIIGTAITWYVLFEIKSYYKA